LERHRGGGDGVSIGHKVMPSRSAGAGVLSFMNKTFITILLATALYAVNGLAKDKETKTGGTDAAFIPKAASGGMAEVQLGKLAAEKGASQEVKDFGDRMVKDHSKANDELKEVAGKMNVMVPEKVDPKHQATIEKMSALTGAAFDKAYVKGMVKAHKEDITLFESADKEVKNEDLKKFIENTLPVMKEHLAMIEKFDQVKK
jgi:putative membrane protein